MEILMSKKASHYIDNKRFLEDISNHREIVQKAKKDGIKPPGVTEYIGQCFLDIANNLAKKPNFANYSFKEEMIGDAVENCIMYATNFDPLKSTNPFAFFTQITFYAFLRRIQKEKKQLYIKLKCFEDNDPTGKFRNWMEERKIDNSSDEVAEIIGLSETDVVNFNKEKKSKLKKTRKRKNANNVLDGFMDE
jgi:hypothetical protein